jgi:hypothetical protein
MSTISCINNVYEIKTTCEYVTQSCSSNNSDNVDDNNNNRNSRVVVMLLLLQLQHEGLEKLNFTC